MGDIDSLHAQTSPYFQLREKFKCIEHIDKSVPSLRRLPEIRKSEQNISQFQLPSLNPNETLNFQMYCTLKQCHFCQKNERSFCSAKASHNFSAKILPQLLCN